MYSKQKQNRIVIAGSRSYYNYKYFSEQCEKYLVMFDIDTVEIVTGGALGVDTMAEKYAIDNNIPVRVFDAKWELFGNRAGVLRNKEMAKYSTHLLAFYRGYRESSSKSSSKSNSKGTRDMLNQARCNDLEVSVILI